jgi:hypothetical protein
VAKNNSKSKTTNIANCVPVPLLKHEEDEDGKFVKLLIPRFRHKWMQWVQNSLKNKYIRLRLDEVGSAVWLLIDGKLTVAEIGVKLEKQLGEKVHPVNERIGLFFSTLKRNGFATWQPVEDSSSPEPVSPA